MTTMVYDNTGVYIDSLCNDCGVSVDENFRKVRTVHKNGIQFNLFFIGSLANVERIATAFCETENLIESEKLSSLLVTGCYMFVHDPLTNELNEYTIIDGQLHQFKCPVPYFYGSGCNIARGAYHICKDATEALKVASIYDLHTNSNIIKAERL